jgi:hypothetical protein
MPEDCMTEPMLQKRSVGLITAADVIPEPTCNLLQAIPNNLTNAKHLSISNNIQILLEFWV